MKPTMRPSPSVHYAWKTILILCSTLVLHGGLSLAASPGGEVVLQSKTLSVTLDGGMPVRIVNQLTGTELLSPSDSAGDAEVVLRGPDGKVLTSELQKKTLTRRSETGDSAEYQWLYKNGAAIRFLWKVEGGDVVLALSAVGPEPIHEFEIALAGFDLASHKLVWVSNFGVANTVAAPLHARTGSQAPGGQWLRGHYVHPLIALFEGNNEGCVVEGRDQKLSPASMGIQGHGARADLQFTRGYALPCKEAKLFPIHLRGYKGNWRKAVDPYIHWMESELGVVPLEKQPEWIRNIRAQSYCLPWEHAPGEPAGIGGIELLQQLASRVDPSQTLVGKVSEYRPRPKYGFDHFYPNYQPTDYAIAFVKRAKEMGFHVAFHVNAFGVDIRHEELIERFKPGLRIMKTDEKDQPVYWGYSYRPYNNAYGKVQFAWCSPAYKPFRDYLIEQIKPMIEAGADIVYLDESHTPLGRFLVDGVTSVEGVRLLQKEIRQTYPGVAIMVEQFNLLNTRYASFALTSHDTGHPLSMYLFGRFVKFTGWHGWYQVRKPEKVERFMRMGWILPGGRKNKDWVAIMRAFQKHELDPAPLLEVDGRLRLFGFRGKSVVAYYEKRNGDFGLAVYDLEGEQVEWHEVQVPSPN